MAGNAAGDHTTSTASGAGRSPHLPSLATDGPVSYAIFRVAKAHRALAGSLLRELGLHPGQELLLMQLWDRDGRTQTELVRELGVDASTVAKSVSRLAEQGLVRREVSATDGRAVQVWLTPDGHELCSRVRQMWSRLEAATVGDLPDGPRRELLEALERTGQRLAQVPR